MSTIIYGISNCDTIKKAKKWLEIHGLEYQFHDYRKHGISLELLNEFESRLGWENLLNKRGTTFRQLDDSDKQDLDRDKALALLVTHPAMVKRPILQHDGDFELGFKAEQYQAVFGR